MARINGRTRGMSGLLKEIGRARWWTSTGRRNISRCSIRAHTSACSTASPKCRVNPQRLSPDLSRLAEPAP
ncbi:MAG: hypothetical protein MZV64_17135 [Ignavibacteriales bacterium]|nr:hypothetical protein [Ignavibacteriales bacterium]